MVTLLARRLARTARASLGPRALRLAERLLAAAGFPTNASGNNVSGR